MEDTSPAKKYDNACDGELMKSTDQQKETSARGPSGTKETPPKESESDVNDQETETKRLGRLQRQEEADDVAALKLHEEDRLTIEAKEQREEVNA